jgi:hypothetical protein
MTTRVHEAHGNPVPSNCISSRQSSEQVKLAGRAVLSRGLRDLRAVAQHGFKQKTGIAQKFLSRFFGHLLRFRPLMLRDLRAIAQLPQFMVED